MGTLHVGQNMNMASGSVETCVGNNILQGRGLDSRFRRCRYCCRDRGLLGLGLRRVVVVREKGGYSFFNTSFLDLELESLFEESTGFGGSAPPEALVEGFSEGRWKSLPTVVAHPISNGSRLILFR